MSSSNRTNRLTKLVTTLKKRFKPQLPAPRPLFESLLYGCLLENSTHEAADKAIAGLEKAYFDWNEVRVSTRTELAEVLRPLTDPAESADRLKRSLQSVFETFYAFDLEPMKKQNLGQSVKQLSACDGVTSFVVAYITQNGLGGHAIALNRGVLLTARAMDLITPAELKKKVIPGLERAVPKNKGIEVGAVLHLLGVEIGRNPYGKAARDLLLELDPTCKDRLPKKPAPPKPKPAPKPPVAKQPPVAKPKSAPKKPEPKPKAKPAAAPKKATPTKKTKKKGATKKAAPVKKKATPKKATPAKKKPATKKATPAKKKPATKKVAPVKKKATPKKVAPAKKKPATKKAKPVKKKATTKKPAPKKKPTTKKKKK